MAEIIPEDISNNVNFKTINENLNKELVSYYNNNNNLEILIKVINEFRNNIKDYLSDNYLGIIYRI